MKTKICVKIANAAKIDAALSAVNGRAMAHVIYDYSDLLRELGVVEKRLAIVLGTKMHWPDVLVRILSGEAIGRAYKYERRGTMVTLTRGKTAWYLSTRIETGEVSTGGGFAHIYLQAAQNMRAIARLHDRYSLKLA